MPLQVATGHASSAGVRERNEDFVGMVTPSGAALASKGVLAAIADGVSGHAGGREASEYAVRGLLTDYYATPDTWAITQALDRVLGALNRWVQTQGQARQELAGMATTLTAVVLRGRRAVIGHVGDTRAYCFRDGALRCLTHDHVWDRPDLSHVLTRAIGLDQQLHVDFSDLALASGDRLLLLSDGVWGSLPQQRIAELCAVANHDAQQLADKLIAGALAAGSQDNVTAAVLEVQALGEDAFDEVLAASAELLPPRLLQAGETLDGFRVIDTLQRNRTNILYKVTDLNTHNTCVLKTLLPEYASDKGQRKQLTHEEWLARRVVARFFPEVVSVDARERTALYYVQTWHAGRTLAETIAADRHLAVTRVLAIAIKVARGVGALHRRSIVHRDLKPDNVHLGEDAEVRILDFGVAESGLAAGILPSRAGTPSFLAPELLTGGEASAQTDLYALGVTVYFALTRHYPYGEVEPFQRPRFGDAVPPTRYRPDVPAWLENVLLKLVAHDPKLRFETAEELLLALEQGAARPLPPPAATPLAARMRGKQWWIIALVSLALNLLLAYLLIAR